MLTEKIIILIITGIIGIGLTFTRRYNNPQNEQAGCYTAGFTLGIIILTMLTYL
jgi:short-subunit dehydrogenase involved in D-alanine esterification of teichoic acids